MIRVVLILLVLLSGFSTFAQKRLKKNQVMVHDSVKNVLKSKGLSRCKVFDSVYCRNVNEVAGKKSDSIPSLNVQETWNLKWTTGNEFEGPFFVVISNMFGEYIFLQSTENDHLELSLNRFAEEKLIMCEVVSANCRKTRMIGLKLLR